MVIVYSTRSQNALIPLQGEGAQELGGKLNIFPTEKRSDCDVIREEENRGDEDGGEEEEGGT